MTDGKNSTDRDDDDRTINDEVADQASIIENTFHLSPETARVTAEDKVASRMRNPAADDVDTARVSQAQEQNAAEDVKK